MSVDKMIIDPGRGVLARNLYKKELKHPDYIGEFVAPDGGKFRVAGWVHKTTDGQQYLSLSIEDEAPLFPRR